jgi:hypothetical protein
MGEGADQPGVPIATHAAEQPGGMDTRDRRRVDHAPPVTFNPTPER